MAPRPPLPYLQGVSATAGETAYGSAADSQRQGFGTRHDVVVLVGAIPPHQDPDRTSRSRLHDRCTLRPLCCPDDIAQARVLRHARVGRDGFGCSHHTAKELMMDPAVQAFAGGMFRCECAAERTPDRRQVRGNLRSCVSLHRRII